MPREYRRVSALGEGNRAAAEAGAGHPRAEASLFAPRKLDHGIQLRTGDLEVVPQRNVALVHQPPHSRDVALLEEIGGGQRARVLRDDVSRAPSRDRIELRLARCERSEIDVA